VKNKDSVWKTLFKEAVKQILWSDSVNSARNVASLVFVWITTINHKEIINKDLIAAMD
jgi:hypothetical protein